jgi:hypothetical protein
MPVTSVTQYQGSDVRVTALRGNRAQRCTYCTLRATVKVTHGLNVTKLCFGHIQSQPIWMKNIIIQFLEKRMAAAPQPESVGPSRGAEAASA